VRVCEPISKSDPAAAPQAARQTLLERPERRGEDGGQKQGRGDRGESNQTPPTGVSIDEKYQAQNGHACHDAQYAVC